MLMLLLDHIAEDGITCDFMGQFTETDIEVVGGMAEPERGERDSFRFHGKRLTEEGWKVKGKGGFFQQFLGRLFGFWDNQTLHWDRLDHRICQRPMSLYRDSDR